LIISEIIYYEIISQIISEIIYILRDRSSRRLPRTEQTPHTGKRQTLHTHEHARDIHTMIHTHHDTPSLTQALPTPQPHSPPPQGAVGVPARGAAHPVGGGGAPAASAAPPTWLGSARSGVGRLILLGSSNRAPPLTPGTAGREPSSTWNGCAPPGGDSRTPCPMESPGPPAP